MKEKAKVIIRCVIFFLIVFAILVVLSDLFEGGTNNNYDKRFYTFRTLEKDTVDGVFIGTSGADRYWNSGRAYNQYGMTIYPLSADAMPGWLYTNMIDEALTYQTPKLFLFDSRGFTQTNTDASVMDARARRVIDAMDFFSINRLKTCIKTFRTVKPFDTSSYQETGLSYIFPFIKFHTIWSDDNYSFDNHIGNKPHRYGGFYTSSARSAKAVKQEPQIYDAETLEPLDPVAEKALYEVIDYIREKDLDALFVITPKFFSEVEMGRLNTMLKILDEQDMPYVTFEMGVNPSNELAVDLDPATEFYDDGHVNYKGANKFTDVFAAYLDAHYDLPDRREDENAKTYWAPLNKRVNTLMKKYDK